MYYHVNTHDKSISSIEEHERVLTVPWNNTLKVDPQTFFLSRNHAVSARYNWIWLRVHQTMHLGARCHVERSRLPEGTSGNDVVTSLLNVEHKSQGSSPKTFEQAAPARPTGDGPAHREPAPCRGRSRLETGSAGPTTPVIRRRDQRPTAAATTGSTQCFRHTPLVTPFLVNPTISYPLRQRTTERDSRQRRHHWRPAWRRAQQIPIRISARNDPPERV